MPSHFAFASMSIAMLGLQTPLTIPCLIGDGLLEHEFVRTSLHVQRHNRNGESAMAVMAIIDKLWAMQMMQAHHSLTLLSRCDAKQPQARRPSITRVADSHDSGELENVLAAAFSLAIAAVAAMAISRRHDVMMTGKRCPVCTSCNSS
jgi:formate dehydrogenase maturation protein FdhE